MSDKVQLILAVITICGFVFFLEGRKDDRVEKMDAKLDGIETKLADIEIKIAGFGGVMAGMGINIP